MALAPAGAVGCNHGRRGVRQQQRLVAHLAWRCRPADQNRPLLAPAIAAREEGGLGAELLEQGGDGDRGRRLAAAAGGEIADADHRKPRAVGRDLREALLRQSGHRACPRGQAPSRARPAGGTTRTAPQDACCSVVLRRQVALELGERARQAPRSWRRWRGWPARSSPGCAPASSSRARAPPRRGLPHRSTCWQPPTCSSSYRHRGNSAQLGPVSTAAPSLIGSTGFCPPRSASEPPTKATGDESIEQAELANRVGDIDVGRSIGQLALRAERHVEIRMALQLLGDQRAALGMPRHDDGEQVGSRAPSCADAPRRRSRPRRDACWRRARPAAGERGVELAPSRQIDRRRRRVGLEVADVERARRAELRRSAAASRSFCASTRSKRREQRPAQARPPPPALEASEDDMRPLTSTSGMSRAFVSSTRFGQISEFDQHREIGPPMVEEALHDSPGCRAAHIDAARPCGSRVRASRAEVTVPVVSSMRSSGCSAAIASITGSTALVSPTLAAWNQARKPGRARRAGDRRSARAGARAPPCRAACARRASAARAALRGASTRDRPRATARAWRLQICRLVARDRWLRPEHRRARSLRERAFDGDRAASMLRVIGILGTRIGSPTTMPSVEKGRLMVKPLQLFSVTKRLVAMAQGTIGRPESLRQHGNAVPARRAGPGGTSAVMATVAPCSSARSAARIAVAPPRSRFRASASAPDQAHAEALERRADQRGVAVTRHHGNAHLPAASRA